MAKRVRSKKKTKKKPGKKKPGPRGRGRPSIGSDVGKISLYLCGRHRAYLEKVMYRQRDESGNSSSLSRALREVLDDACEKGIGL